jgi:sugar phosphate permease
METNRLRTIPRFRWLIFIILACAYLLVYFHRLSMSVLADDLTKDFQTTASVIGLLGSLYFYCYAAMQIPAGLLSDSWGPRKTVSFFLLIATAGSILFGLSPNIGVAFIGRAMVGLGVSMVFIPTMKILSQWFRTREFAFMTGILNAVGGCGALAATGALALAGELVGWRISFEFIGLSTFLIVILVWLVVRDRPEEKGWPSLAEIDNLSEETLQRVEAIPLWQGVKRVAGEKYFWPMAIWFFFDCGIFFGFGGLWAGPYLQHVYGLTKNEVGSVLSMVAWGMIFGSPILGLLSDRIVKSRKKILMAASSVLVIEVTLLMLFPDGLPRPILYLAFLVLSICASSIVVIAFTTTKELFPVEIAGTSTGMVNIFPFLGGAVFMPLLGRILDGYAKSVDGAYPLEAYKVLLTVLFVSSLVALACTFLMKETYSEA